MRERCDRLSLLSPPGFRLNLPHFHWAFRGEDRRQKLPSGSLLSLSVVVWAFTCYFSIPSPSSPSALKECLQFTALFSHPSHSFSSFLFIFFSHSMFFFSPLTMFFFCPTVHANQQDTLVFDESRACNWPWCQTLCGEILKVSPHFYWRAAKKTFFPAQIFTQLWFHDIGSAALFWMSLLVRLSRKTVITAVDGDTVQTCAGIGWLDSARIFTS